MREKEFNASHAYVSDETRRAKYVLYFAGVALLAALVPDLQKHMRSEPRVVYDAEGITIPETAPPQNLCEAVQQQALRECDQLMEETWYSGGATNYQREQHLKDFPRCQTLSNNIFQSCLNYGQ
jgi:hypothetical protein